MRPFLLMGLVCLLSSCGSGLRNHRVSGTIQFERDRKGQWTANIDPDNAQPTIAIVWPDRFPRPEAERSKRYSFEYMDEPQLPAGSEGVRMLLRIWDGDKLFYDASVCEVHEVSMDRQPEEVVGIEMYHPYRRSYFDKKTGRPEKWPNDGKVYSPCDSGIRHKAWRCPECHRLSEVWREARGIP